jgi:hypothetical protein
MDFLKKHYEKIILSLVLLGLVGALVFLPVIISSDQEQQRTMSAGIIQRKPAPLPPLDLTEQDNMLEQLKSPYVLDFSTTNKLFNPMQWQKTVSGPLIKVPGGNAVNLVAVTKITPLYFILTFDSVETNEFGARYDISFERQAAISYAQRRGQRFVSTDDPKKDLFTLLQVKGPAANPDQLILKLADTGETAIVSKNKPFERVEGYEADLKYDPEGKKWQNQRVGADLKFDSDDYIIVAIHQNEVILSAESNQKKTVLTYTP